MAYQETKAAVRELIDATEDLSRLSGTKLAGELEVLRRIASDYLTSLIHGDEQHPADDRGREAQMAQHAEMTAGFHATIGRVRAGMARLEQALATVERL